MDNPTTIFSALGAVAIAVIAAIFLRIALRARDELRASGAWPTALGQITASKVATLQRRSGSGNSYESHDAEIAYAYAIDGATFTGDRIHAGSSLGIFNPGMTATKARALVERYPAGMEVTVAYDPAMPEKAVLEPGVGGGRIWMMTGVAIALVVIAGFLVVVAIAAAMA